VHGVKAFRFPLRQLLLAHAENVEALFQQVLKNGARFTLLNGVRLDDAKGSLDGHFLPALLAQPAALAARSRRSDVY
jgi:hypothetical protein